MANGCKLLGRWGDLILADGCEYLAVGCTIELACGATALADGWKFWRLVVFFGVFLFQGGDPTNLRGFLSYPTKFFTKGFVSSPRSSNPLKKAAM